MALVRECALQQVVVRGALAGGDPKGLKDLSWSGSVDSVSRCHPSGHGGVNRIGRMIPQFTLGPGAGFLFGKIEQGDQRFDAGTGDGGWWDKWVLS